jgi:hypothetical protein
MRLLQKIGFAVAVCGCMTAVAQQNVAVMRTSGKVLVNGAQSTSASIFAEDKVDATGGSILRGISEGNSLIFTADSSFIAKKNAYRLEKGGSKVATFTGLTAEVNCFSITPVTPILETLYEVNWASPAVYVYARTEDVYIRWGDGKVQREWILKQGKVARLRNVRACEPLVDIFPLSIAPYAIATGATSASIILAETYPWSDMSQESPGR